MLKVLVHRLLPETCSACSVLTNRRRAFVPPCWPDGVIASAWMFDSPVLRCRCQFGPHHCSLALDDATPRARRGCGTIRTHKSLYTQPLPRLVRGPEATETIGLVASVVARSRRLTPGSILAKQCARKSRPKDIEGSGTGNRGATGLVATELIDSESRCVTMRRVKDCAGVRVSSPGSRRQAAPPHA